MLSPTLPLGFLLAALAKIMRHSSLSVARELKRKFETVYTGSRRLGMIFDMHRAMLAF